MEASQKNFFFVLFAVFLVVGIYDALTNQVENECEMTYMRQHPRYLKVPMETKVEQSYSNYSLYLYGEGEYFGRISKLNLEGIPVLFIPGHAGSYKQMRSLGSTLIRRSSGRSDDLHFNVFGADLNRELTAVHGAALMKQQNFIEESIDKILSLYPQDDVNRPTSVVLVGHSMGGILTRGLLESPTFDRARVRLVITLASPHLLPVFDIDNDMHQYYQMINKEQVAGSVGEESPVIISIAGGDQRDLQVVSALTRIPINSTSAISVESASIPHVHVQADHQCIVWCKQLVVATTRMLFDSVDPDTRQITASPQWLQRAARHHFIRHSGVTSVDFSKDEMKEPKMVELIPTYTWKGISSRCWTSRDYKSTRKGGAYFAFPIRDLLRDSAREFVARTEIDRDGWVLGCKQNGDGRCTTAVDLSGRAMLIGGGKFRVVHLDLKELQDDLGLTHVVMPVSWTRFDAVLDVNVIQKREKPTKAACPYTLSGLWTFNKGSAYSSELATRQCRNRFYHQLELAQFGSFYQVLQVTARPSKPVTELASRVEIPWDEGASVYGRDDVTIRLRRSAPTTEATVKVHYYVTTSNTSKRINFNVKFCFMDFLGRIIRHFGPTLPMFAVTNAVMVLGYQLNQMLTGHPLHDLGPVHNYAANPFKFQAFLVFGSMITGNPTVKARMMEWNLPHLDTSIMEYNGIWFGLGPIFLFMLGFEIFRFVLLVHSVVIYVIRFPIRLLPAFASENFRMATHSAVIAYLLSQHSFLALIYCYVITLGHAAQLRDRVHPAPKEATPEEKKAATKKLAAISPGDVTSSDDDDDSIGMTTTDDEDAVFVKGGSGDAVALSSDKEPPAEEKPPASPFGAPAPPPKLAMTSPSQDAYAWALVKLQIWFYLLIFTAPSFIAVVHRNGFSWAGGSGDSMFPLTVVASLLFCVTSCVGNHMAPRSRYIPEDVDEEESKEDDDKKDDGDVTEATDDAVTPAAAAVPPPTPGLKVSQGGLYLLKLSNYLPHMLVMFSMVSIYRAPFLAVLVLIVHEVARFV